MVERQITFSYQGLSWPLLGGAIAHMTVARIWAKQELKPHRLEGYLAPNDPELRD